MFNENNNKRITAPVGIVADIAKALGVGSGDLGYLCSNKHGKTNKWSRFKPIKIPNTANSGNAFLDIHLLKDYENGGTLYKADGTCGIRIPYTRGISTKIYAQKYFNGEMKWGVDAPEPNALYPARALDFDGYYVDAQPPIDTSNIQSDVWLEGNRFAFGFDIAHEGTKYNLGLTDIDIRQVIEDAANITEWYPGLLFHKGSVYKAITSDNKLGNAFNVNFEYEGTDFPGTWEVVPFLSEIPVNTWTGDEQYGYYIGMDVDPFQITIHKAGTLIYGLINAYWINTEEKTIGFVGYITNNDSSVKTVDATLWIYSTSSNEKDPYEDGNSQNESGQGISLGTYTVSPNGGEINFSTVNENGDIPLVTVGRYDPSRFYWAGVSIDGGSVPTGMWVQLEQEIIE